MPNLLGLLLVAAAFAYLMDRVDDWERQQPPRKFYEEE